MDDFTVGREPPPVVGASDDIVPVVVIVDIDGREPPPVVGGSDDIVPVVVVIIIDDDGAGIIVDVVVIVGVGVNVAIVGKFGLVYDTVGISVIRTVVGMAVGDTDGLSGILSGQLK